MGGGQFQGNTTIGIWTLPFMESIHPDHKDAKGFSLVNLTSSDGWHDDKKLVQDADWSKQDLNGRIIWHQGYEVFIRENDKDNLFINLKNLEPDPNEAPY